MSSLWESTAGTLTCPNLDIDSDTDVAIVGGGYTGLWTALWLSAIDPSLHVTLLEAKQCGHGASGRNGGWVMGSIEGLRTFTDSGTGRLPDKIIHTLRQVLPEFTHALETFNISCDFEWGGALYSAARVPQQLNRARLAMAEYLAMGYTEADYRWLSASEARGMVNANGTVGGIYASQVAVMHPRKLVLGLVSAVLNNNVKVIEHCAVTSVKNNRLRISSDTKSARGNTSTTLSARAIVWATEGYTDTGLPLSDRFVPVHSGMVATEPLPNELWETLGFNKRQAFCDFSRLSTYLQRTADNRLVVGARGRMLYHATPGHTLHADPRDTRARITLARQLFPSLGDTAFPFAWGGTLAVARKQTPHVVFDQHKQWLTAGGYTGEGVGASFLMGRTLAELLVGHQSARTAMPWVRTGSFQQQLPPWEPQPLPYLAFQGMTQCYRLEEHYDAQNAQHLPARLARWGAATITKLLGR